MEPGVVGAATCDEYPNYQFLKNCNYCVKSDDFTLIENRDMIENIHRVLLDISSLTQLACSLAQVGWQPSVVRRMDFKTITMNMCS